MTFAPRLVLGAATLMVPMLACAQTPAPAADKSLMPDPSHVPFILADDIPWTGTAGRQQQYKVLGDPAKAGPYILLMKWYPGAYSRPHYHEKTRYITVISGVWWVSSSNHYDPAKTYPLPAGTVVRDEAMTVHWDGAKDAPVVLQIVGDGPVTNVNVGEDGKPLPPRAPGAAGE